MTFAAPPITASLRPLFLAIARASIAGSALGFSAEQRAQAHSGSPDAPAPWAAQRGPEPVLSATGHDSAVAPQAPVSNGSLCAVGRRPAGLRSAGAPSAGTRIGAFLAQAAHLEAASVRAFYVLLRELRVLGAPEALRKAALDAILDEVRHAQEVSELANAHGTEVARPEIETTALRSAYALALDNIGEGCVRETFGALQATYQAETAADPRVRAMMGQIAEDETRHAELAWQLQAWLESRLSDAQREHVRAERKRVLDALAGNLYVDLSGEECAALGYPTPEASNDMLRSLSQALYA
jgi:hypothetical protein